MEKQKRNKQIHSGRRMGAAILGMIVAVSSLMTIPPKESEAATYNISNPRIVKDDSMESGQKVTWDCVWFGSYPQAEVLSTTMEEPIITDIQNGNDFIKDDALYSQLQSAVAWNANGDITINGEKYHRMQRSDATFARNDDDYYNWWTQGTDTEDYHYFKYQPIKWRVLQRDGNSLFLHSDIALDDKKYNEERESVTWKTSTIRSWLNGYNAADNQCAIDYSSSNFVDMAFTSSEQNAISTTTVENKDNLSYGTEGGEDTSDKIFLLSESEVYTENAVKYGFVEGRSTDDEARRRKSSTFSKAMGTWSSTYDNYRGNCCWWLRSPGYDADNAASVNSYGWADTLSIYVDCSIYGMCPALNLNLSSLEGLAYAGTVCSDGTEEEVGETSTPTEEEQEEFIQMHLDYVNDYKYTALTDFKSLQEIVFYDSDNFINSCKKWKAIRFDIFENPFEIVLSDLILSENTVNSQKELFESNVNSNGKKLITSVIDLIDTDSGLSFDEKNKIQKLFSSADYSDSHIFQLVKSKLQKVDESRLKAIFTAADKTNTVLDLWGNGEEIVNAVLKMINYCSLLNAYLDTSQEFKDVLWYMHIDCNAKNGNLSSDEKKLDKALKKYINIEDDDDIRKELIKKSSVVSIQTAFSVGWDLFENSIVGKVRKFLFGSMNLSTATTAVAEKVSAIAAGLKIGYDIGTTFNNIVFNTDGITNAYVDAYATAETASYLKNALDYYAESLKEEKTLSRAKHFCQAFGMYKNIQQNMANKMIEYCVENEKTLIYQIVDLKNMMTGLIKLPPNSMEEEAAIYRWQLLKMNWQNANCHDPNSVLVKRVKNMTISCPVDVTIYDSSNNVILKIEDNQITEQTGNVTAVVRNQIKYIMLDDDTDYRVEVHATDEGTMQYKVTSYDVENDTAKTINFENISLQKDQEFTGEVNSGDDLTQTDYALVSNGETVDSNCKVYSNTEKVNVSDIILSAENLELNVGENEQIISNILPADASDKNVTWYSEDASVAKVDEYGNVTAIAGGSTNVVCETLDGTVMKSCGVTVKSGQSGESTTENPTTEPIEIESTTTEPDTGEQITTNQQETEQPTTEAETTTASVIEQTAEQPTTASQETTKVQEKQTSPTSQKPSVSVGSHNYGVVVEGPEDESSSKNTSSIKKKKVAGFKAKAGKKKVSLSWKKLKGATGYKIYMKTSSKGKLKLIKTTKKTNFNKTKLTSKKSYYFVIKAYKKSGGRMTYSKPVLKKVKVK